MRSAVLHLMTAVPEHTAVVRIEPPARSRIEFNDEARCAFLLLQGTNSVLADPPVFVCQVCAGVCRDFGRVKGISMSNFTDDEAKALEEGGNKVLRPQYWAYFDPARNPRIPVGNPELLKPVVEALLKLRKWHIDNAANAKLPIVHPYFSSGVAGGAARPVGDAGASFPLVPHGTRSAWH